ncbi:hypothetical protein HOT57_gp36 [Pseudomonas phage phCDa]|uniref:Uncharacterized protein n=1 Tax=Pseudomonas phage phCDa TaxID=2268587 RepID=A0A2Z5H8R5_9CAUD|nr:hypothetical protein HOT57_gp36 [Pseudomonas phage phCDa]AXC36480.1 hypothetical protein phCDa_36 [Pseudomonas phage phCDa]
MAVERKTTQAAPATSERNERTAKKTLGFFNVNIETRAGAPVRLEGIRFIEGNKQHEQLAAYLSVTQASDKDFTPEQIVEEKARRLAVVATKLTYSFNATRTDEESMLDLV